MTNHGYVTLTEMVNPTTVLHSIELAQVQYILLQRWCDGDLGGPAEFLCSPAHVTIAPPR